MTVLAGGKNNLIAELQNADLHISRFILDGENHYFRAEMKYVEKNITYVAAKFLALRLQNFIHAQLS